MNSIDNVLHRNYRINALGFLIIIIFCLLMLSISSTNLNLHPIIEGLCMKGCKRPNTIIASDASGNIYKNSIRENKCTIYSNGFMECPWVCTTKDISGNTPHYNPSSLDGFEKNKEWVMKNVVPASVSNPDNFFQLLTQNSMNLLVSPFKRGLSDLEKQLDDKYSFNSDNEKNFGSCKADTQCSSCTPYTILTK